MRRTNPIQWSLKSDTSQNHVSFFEPYMFECFDFPLISQ
jgi:hypothetical protein